MIECRFDMLTASLYKGKIVLSESRVGHKAKKLRFDPKDHVAIGEYVFSLGFEPRIICLSSCDFPEENGLEEAYDFNAVMSAAFTHARMKRAVRIPPPKMEDALNVFEKACAGRDFPFMVVFERAGAAADADGHLGDITMTFNNEDELTAFWNGMGYARALARVNGLLK